MFVKVVAEPCTFQTIKVNHNRVPTLAPLANQIDMGTRGRGLGPAFTPRTRPTGVPPRKRKRRPRHHHVTTVPSTGSFLAPRSARRSDASQTQPGGRRAEACGAEGSLAGCGTRAARSKTCGARAAGQASARLAPRSARRSDAPNASGQSAGGSLRRHRPPARLRRPRVQTQPGRGCSRRSLRRTHARARAFALVRSCVGATRHRSRTIPPAGAHLGPRPPKQLVWRSRTPPRMGERAPSRRALDHPHQPAARPQIAPARAPPRALPASHLTDGRRMAAKTPRGDMKIL